MFSFCLCGVVRVPRRLSSLGTVMLKPHFCFFGGFFCSKFPVWPLNRGAFDRALDSRGHTTAWARGVGAEIVLSEQGAAQGKVISKHNGEIRKYCQIEQLRWRRRTMQAQSTTLAWWAAQNVQPSCVSLSWLPESSAEWNSFRLSTSAMEPWKRKSHSQRPRPTKWWAASGWDFNSAGAPSH